MLQGCSSVTARHFNKTTLCCVQSANHYLILTYQQGLRFLVPRPGLLSANCTEILRSFFSLAERRVSVSARGRRGNRGDEQPSSNQVPAADATQLLRALVQLASRNTIIIGSHQAFALMENLETLLPQQLSNIPTITLSSGLWAMTRLQLKPSDQLIAAVAQHLLQPENGRGQADTVLPSRLQCCNARTVGTLCYSLNFFMLRDPSFWIAAAAAAQPHIQLFKPAGISNLVQGLALCGWSTPLQSRSQIHAAQQPQQQAGVKDLLQSVEDLLVSEPDRLRSWRMRDISQLCQAYALLGWNCTLLFATIANHLLEYISPPRPPPTAAAAAAPGSVNSSAGPPAGPSWLQQQQQQWASSQANGPITRPTQPCSTPSASSTSPPAAAAGPTVGWQAGNQHYHRPWHDKGRGPRRLIECQPGDAAGLAWAFVAAWCTNQLLLQELAVVVTARAPRLHAADCSRLLWAYATAGVVDKSMLTAVTGAVAEEMSTVLPRTAAACLWSLALMGFEAPGFTEAALDRLAACLEATPTVEAPCQSPSPAAASAVSSSPAVSSSDDKAQELAGAGESAGLGALSLLQQLYQDPPAALLSRGPEVSSDVSEELSKLTMKHTRRYRRRPRQQQQQDLRVDGVATEADTYLQDPAQAGGQQGDQAVTVSSSRAPFQPTQGAIWQQQQYQLSQLGHHDADPMLCTPRDVAQAIHACGRLQHYNAAFCSVLRVRFKGLLSEFSDEELVEVLWGLARLNLYDASNMTAAVDELLSRVDGFSGSLVGLTAWSFARLKHANTELFSALSRRACQLAQQKQLKPLDANQLVCAAAKLGFRDDVLFRACAGVLSKAVPRMRDSLLISSMWGFAVAGVFHGQLFGQGFKKISILPPSKARPLLLLKLFQTATLLRDAYSSSGQPAPVSLPSGLLLAATRQWMFSNRRSPGGRRSTLHSAVVMTLKEGLGLKVDQEVLTDDGLFSIDAAVIWQGRRVAVEVDGPDHFTNSTPHVLLGSTLAKHRCLQARGWAVLSVPFHNWNNLTAGGHQQLGSKRRQRLQHSDSNHQPAATGQSAGPPGWQDAGSHDDHRSASEMSVRSQYLQAALDQAVVVADAPMGLQPASKAAITVFS